MFKLPLWGVCMYLLAPLWGYLKLPKEKKPPPFPYRGLLMLGIDWGINYTFHSHINKRNFKMIAWGPKTFFAQEPLNHWTIFGTPHKGQEPVSRASIILKMMQEPCKIETSAHRVSLYSCGLHVLWAQGLVVHNMNSLQKSTDFGFYHAFGRNTIITLWKWDHSL